MNTTITTVLEWVWLVVGILLVIYLLLHLFGIRRGV